MLFFSLKKLEQACLKASRVRHVSLNSHQTDETEHGLNASDSCLSAVSYERILCIENLSDVPNPWKGFTVNRCLVAALVVLLVSSGVNEVHGECQCTVSLPTSDMFWACFWQIAVICNSRQLLCNTLSVFRAIVFSRCSGLFCWRDRCVVFLWKSAECFNNTGMVSRDSVS